ncbi:hypothetical protein ACOSP7_014566 [Xanthoceras sorbifolium]
MEEMTSVVDSLASELGSISKWNDSLLAVEEDLGPGLMKSDDSADDTVGDGFGPVFYFSSEGKKKWKWKKQARSTREHADPACHDDLTLKRKLLLDDSITSSKKVKLSSPVNTTVQHDFLASSKNGA